MATTVSRKRKAAADDSVSISTRSSKTRKTALPKSRTDKAESMSKSKGHDTVKVLSEPTNAKHSKRQREPEEIRTPQNKRFKDAIPPTPSETPTRGASRLFDRLNLASTTSAPKPKDALAYSSPPLTPRSHDNASFPPAVNDTVQLFAAFHSAWSLFIAHNGSGTPIHLIEMLARVTSNWKRRRVTLEDIRRLLGVLGAKSPFIILDHGDGDLCLDTKEEAALSTILQTKQMVKEFEQLLRRQWTNWCAMGEEGDAKGEAFVRGLPLAAMATSEVAIDKSRISKGAQRLTMIKQTAIAAAEESSMRKLQTVADESKTVAAVESRGANLIDRILAKQQLASSRPGGPTREELQRRSALDRIEEAVLVLGLLAGGRPRASFSMQSLVQHLQNSMRNPVARHEAEECVELMAKEICPRFVSLIRTGSVYGVTLTKMGRPSNADLKERLSRAQGNVKL